MIDHFAVLGLPRRPWLDSEKLKERFHELAGSKHPDAPTGDSAAFSKINTAYQVLRDPATRLRHLLELEYATGEGEMPSIPESLAERFMHVATLLRGINVFLKQQPSNASALTRSLTAGDRFALERDAEKLIAALETDRARLEELLRVEDSLWDQRDHQTPFRLASLQYEFAYIARWISQIEEVLLQLRS